MAGTLLFTKRNFPGVKGLEIIIAKGRNRWRSSEGTTAKCAAFARLIREFRPRRGCGLWGKERD